MRIRIYHSAYAILVCLAGQKIRNVPVIVEILPRPHLILHSTRVHVRKSMLPVVPPPEAKIQTPDERQFVVNNHELLMVRPVERHVTHVLEYIVVGMPHDFDIAISRTPLRTQALEGMLRMLAIACYRSLDLSINDNVDFDSCLGPPLQHLIQAPFLIVVRRPPEKELGRDPPILDIDDLFRPLERDADGVEVILPVDVPLDFVSGTLRGEGAEAVRFADSRALVVCSLLMLLVVSVVGVGKVLELAELVLQVVGFLLELIEVGVCADFRGSVGLFVPLIG